MKISYNWLKDYLNISLPTEELSAILTEIGLEVAKVEHYEAVKGGLEGLVIGKVLTCEKHPNADKLSVTTVDVGGKVLPVVCGAPNVAEGQKVVVATVGTKLYDGDKVFEIKKSKIRGEVSEGMICAEDEIGLGDDHSGIMVLNDNAPVGKPAKEYFDIYTDTVFEIDITPNRSDAISHFGVARDLYAYLKTNRNLDIELKLPDISNFSIDNKNLDIEVEVRNTDACPRYTGLSMTNIEIKESPEWMQNRLKAIGLKPINNVVDITNYVLHEIGHPLHAFDAQKIKGNQVVVSTVEKGTKFTTLEEKEIELTDKDLMICDADLRPMCIGGVMGGIESGITENSKSVFLESAFFNPVWVRKTAKYHGISTDASYRFERGVDPNNCLWTLKRCALLIKELAGGEISSEIKDVYPQEIKPYEVKLTFKQLDKITGIKIDKEKVKEILNVLEIKITEETEEYLKLQVPTYRFDVTREADVIEEIIRIYGYNNFHIQDKFKTSLIVQERPVHPVLTDKVVNLLVGRGFYEIISFSLLSHELFDKLNEDKTKLVEIVNPLSKELDVLRPSLIFGALDAVARNINHQNQDLKLFERGNVFSKTEKENFDDKYVHDLRLALTLTGNRDKQDWQSEQETEDFYTLKGYVDFLLKALNFSDDDFKIRKFSDEHFAYGLEYLINNKVYVRFGSVSKKLLKLYDIKQHVYFAEFSWYQLIDRRPDIKKFKELPKYPKVRRDLAMLLDKNTEYEKLRKLVIEADKRIIKEVNIFDVYEGEKLPENKKSYAISIILQDENKTLNDKVVNKIMNKIIYKLENQLGAEIRK